MLLPVLGGPLGEETDRLKADGDVLRYHDHTFPLREGTAGLPLPQLLDAQWYRPVWWRLARTELNYRRFFSISELIGVRVEDPEVFEATHAKILELLHEGVVDGLRVDHPDGLADPGRYLRRLHEATGAAGRWWRRSSPTARRCPPPGRSPAPPATTPCATSTGCSWTRRGSGAAGPLPGLRGPADGPGRRLGRHGAAGRVQGAHARAGRRDRPAHPGGGPAVRDLPGDRAAGPRALGAAHRPDGAAGAAGSVPALLPRARPRW